VRRIALTVRAEALEPVLDRLLPLLPQGVHPTDVDDGVELAVFGSDVPRAELEALAGDALLRSGEQEAPDDPVERRRRFGRSWEIAGRLVVRPPDAPPGRAGLPELVIESPSGAFGTGAHPTTRMCLELLLDLEPAGGFADLGCGAGVVAIAAAQLGWEPVFAVDVEARAIHATRQNAERNGVEVHAVQADLREVPPPPASALAANMPLSVHERVAAGLDRATEHVIVSGIVEDAAATACELYGAAGLSERARKHEKGWVAIWLAR
jgi:ribosomal protein L11 methyltransferase